MLYQTITVLSFVGAAALSAHTGVGVRHVATSPVSAASGLYSVRMGTAADGEQHMRVERARCFFAHVLMQSCILAEMGIPCVGECQLDAYPLLPASVHPGVVTGQALIDLLNDAKEKGYAIPAVNCVTSSSVNACLEAARKMDAPIIIQFSSGGSQFYAGKGLDNTDFKAAIAGAVSGAYHVRAMAEQYGVPVILHTDHCAKNLLPWLDGMLSASERYYAAHGEPLFSSHMLDLSEEVCVPFMRSVLSTHDCARMSVLPARGKALGRRVGSGYAAVTSARV